MMARFTFYIAGFCLLGYAAYDNWMFLHNFVIHHKHAIKTVLVIWAGLGCIGIAAALEQEENAVSRPLE